MKSSVVSEARPRGTGTSTPARRLAGSQRSRTIDPRSIGPVWFAESVIGPFAAVRVVREKLAPGAAQQTRDREPALGIGDGQPPGGGGATDVARSSKNRASASGERRPSAWWRRGRRHSQDRGASNERRARPRRGLPSESTTWPRTVVTGLAMIVSSVSSPSPTVA